MKALACRRPIGAHEGDIGDLRFLIKKMKIQSIDEIQAALNAFYPDDIILPRDLELLKRAVQKHPKQKNEKRTRSASDATDNESGRR